MRRTWCGIGKTESVKLIRISTTVVYVHFVLLPLKKYEAERHAAFLNTRIVDRKR